MSLPTNYANSGDDWRAAQAENATEMIDRTAGAHSTDHIIRHTVQQIEDSNKQTFDETESKEIYRQLLQTGRPVQRTEQQYKRPEQPTVYLTFDDGPSRLTPQILDILQDEGVPATFFVLGKLAEQNADTLQRIVHEGHAVGNHTYDHDYSKLYTNFGEFFGQVERTDEIIHQVTGSRTPLFRAPGGTYANFEAFYSYYMEQSGFVVYDWDVDSGDSKRRGVPASEIIANVKNAPLKHEMNVLLHDGAGHGETVKALPEIIRYYKKLGYSFAALDRSVEPRRFTMKGLRWERTISEQNHLHYMELVSRFRAERGADFIDLSQASPTSGKQLTLSINGRTHILEERDYMVVDGHFQVPLGRLVEGLGGKVVQRLDSGGGVADRMIRGKSMARIRFAERMSGHEPGNDLSAAKSMSGYVLGNGLSAAERMPGYVLGNNISIADRMVSYESMNGIDMNIDSQALRTLRIDAYMNGYAVTYYPYEKMMEVQVSSGRTVARSRVQMHMKDGRLFVPLRGTVEMLGGTIPSYTLTNEKQEVRIDMGARDPGKPIPAVVAVGGVWK